MSQLVTIEAVSDKFKNKYSNGSVKANGVWMQVSSKVPLSLFTRDTQMNVETKTNDKGYTSIVGVADSLPTAEGAEKPKRAKKETTEVGTTRTQEDVAPRVTSYEDNKNRRILVQGITQSVAGSPATINFGNEPAEIAAKILEIADILIAEVEKRF